MRFSDGVSTESMRSISSGRLRALQVYMRGGRNQSPGLTLSLLCWKTMGSETDRKKPVDEAQKLALWPHLVSSFRKQKD